MSRSLPKKDRHLNQPVKVLIVDDEASQRSGLAAMVTAWGMTAQMAADGEDALVQLADSPPM